MQQTDSLTRLSGACSWTCLSACLQPDGIAQWNTPLDFTYAFTSVDGWPQLLVTVMETDIHERQQLAGYGVLRLPVQPGMHTRIVPVSRPRGSWTQRMTSFFVGGRARYDHPLVLLSSDSRFGHETESVGTIELQISVALQGFDQPNLRHVHFSTDRSKAAIEAASVCLGCPSSRKPAEAADDDEEEDERTQDSQTEGARPLLNKKEE